MSLPTTSSTRRFERRERSFRSFQGHKLPGSKWIYRDERYTICGYNPKNSFYLIYEDKSSDMVNEITDYNLDELFTPFIEVGHIYKHVCFLYADEENEYEIKDIFTSLHNQRDYKLFVKIDDRCSSKREGYDILYEDMVDLIDKDRLALIEIDRLGAICKKCNKHFEYANFAVDFRCWACKNGY